MKQPSYLLLLAFYLASSCTEEYQLRTLHDARILTMEGCVTDEAGPYMIKLMENVSNLAGDITGVKQEPVVDARVTITDDVGNRDELKPVWKERVVSKKVLGYLAHGNDSIFFTRYYLLLPHYDGSYDSISLSYEQTSIYNIIPTTDSYKGFYYTTSITGVPGRTYTLTVEHNGKTYTAADRMPYGTTLDSVVMRPAGIDGNGKGGDGFHVPYLYFPEPQDREDFYLFTGYFVDSVYYNRTTNRLPESELLHKIIFQNNSHITWGIIPVSDRFMSPYMANYKMGDGATSYNFYSATDVGWQFLQRGCMDIYMASVSKPAFRYFQMLTEQFYRDGGAFSPAPVSPPSNIGNGAQGYFMAASVAVRRSNYYNKYQGSPQ